MFADSTCVIVALILTVALLATFAKDAPGDAVVTQLDGVATT